MIDPSKGLYPVVHFSSLETTEDCIVLGCSYDRNYPELLVSAVEALRELGWNKGIYYRIGGFANPTQEEIRYAGVPYAMKMFLLKEAHLLGFKNLLWLNASVWPIQNPEFCFEKIRKEGIFCEMGRPNTLLTIPQTRSILEKYCGEDLSKVDHCAGWILGFDMSRVAVQQLFEDFYEMARLGTPFISITPEEMVLSVLIHKHFGSVPRQQRLMLPDEKERSRFIQARKEGYKFMIRRH